MSTPIPEGLGKCGLCHRSIRQTDAIDNVMLGRPPRAYICHKSCKKAKEAKEGPLPQLTQTDYLKLAPEPTLVVEEPPEPPWVPDDAELEVVRQDMAAAIKADFTVLTEGLVPPEQIPSLVDVANPPIEDVPVPEPQVETPLEPPVKKAPAKKAPAKKAGKPQLISRTEKIDKITVEKDEPIPPQETPDAS